jgi:hypothetical protein
MENHGALVGWSHQDLNERILLRLESVRSSSEADRNDPDMLRVLLSKQQAAVLGSYLLSVAGQSAPDPAERGWFRRLFG